jgi:hypothetical protein
MDDLRPQTMEQYFAGRSHSEARRKAADGTLP